MTMQSKINHNTLSKSSFKIAQSCPTKLYYKKNGYPSANDENEYLEFLAEGGYAVGTMAKLYYPDGIEIETSLGTEAAINRTQELLTHDNVVIFEAMLYSNRKLVAIDILEKVGNHFNLIEVKSKGIKEDLKMGNQWQEHVEDITFQKITLQECFPESIIDSFLFVPNKDKETEIDNLYSQFKIEKNNSSSNFQNFDVNFKGNSVQIVNDNLLIKFNLNDKVEANEPQVTEAANQYIAQLISGEKPITPISKECFKCEYTTQKNNGVSGYDECWSEIDTPEHHIKYLYQLGRLKLGTENLANKLINENKVSLSDIPFEALTMSYKKRQKLQINNTLAGTEWHSDEMSDFMELAPYPHHFIDFETITTAIPFHKGMRPYEMIAFQWSCHTIESEGAEPFHSEWLNREPSYPEFRFAESLYEQIGNTDGTIFTWGIHENTVLRNIHNRMVEQGYDNQNLINWLNRIVTFDKDNLGKLFDMNVFTLAHYFHPKMKGKTSIKLVLPSVLSATTSNNIEYWLINFETDLNLLTKSSQGEIENPYKNLPTINDIDISEGTGAMRGYTEMLYGEDIKRTEYKKALLRYCKLDTLAMVIIWEHWKSIT